MAIAAVIAGHGVALVPRMYVENELSYGMLVSPWPASCCLSKKFCLVKPTETGINEAALESFERWLLAEMNRPTSFNAER
jgi:DNA-binding transcriptional LysR family regulator